MKIYISGKISGLDMRYVEKQFALGVRFAAEHLPNFEPVSPLDGVEDQSSKTYKEHMIRDIAMLWDCEAILMLPHWPQSVGAKIEYAIAKHLNKLIYYVPYDFRDTE